MNIEDGAVTSFATERLRAERMTAAHANYLAELHLDAEVMANIGGVRDAAHSAEWLDRNLAHWREHRFGQWMFRDADDHLVGRGGLRWIDPCVNERIVEVGYVFQRSAWGAGLATEATVAIVTIASEHYGLTQLGAITAEGNDASSRVLTKCGFEFERVVQHDLGPHRFFRLAR